MYVDFVPPLAPLKPRKEVSLKVACSQAVSLRAYDILT